MNKTSFDKSPNSDELLPEYNFDYNQAKPNRFAPKTEKQKRQSLDRLHPTQAEPENEILA